MSNGELALGERALLYHVAYGSNQVHQCLLSTGELAKRCGITTRYVRMLVNTLCQKGFLLVSPDPHYLVAWPYCVNYTITEKSAEKRIFLQLDEAKHLRSLCAEKEREYTALALSAAEDKDHVSNRRYSVLVDKTVESADKLDRFIAAFGKGLADSVTQTNRVGV